MTIVADEDKQRSYSYISGSINPLIAGVAMAMLAKIEFKFIINQAIEKAKEEILKIENNDRDRKTKGFCNNPRQPKRANIDNQRTRRR